MRAGRSYLLKVGDVVGGPVAARQLLSHVSAGHEARDLLSNPQQPRLQVLARREFLEVQYHVSAQGHSFRLCRGEDAGNANGHLRRRLYPPGDCRLPM